MKIVENYWILEDDGDGKTYYIDGADTTGRYGGGDTIDYTKTFVGPHYSKPLERIIFKAKHPRHDE